MPKTTNQVIKAAGLSADTLARLGEVSEIPEKAVYQLKKLEQTLASGKTGQLCPKLSKSARKQRQQQKSLVIQASRVKAAALAIAA